jgi:hypothetical protein
MRDKRHDRDLDMLSMCDLDAFFIYVLAVVEMPVELEPVNHFDPVVLEY